MTLRRATALASALLWAGCRGQETAPPTQIDRLRVLSIRIDGPSADGQALAELAPGDSATLTPLVLAPGIAPVGDMTAEQTVCLRGGQPSWDREASGGCVAGASEAKVQRFWFWCPPAAEVLFDDVCTDIDALAAPAQVLVASGVEPLGADCDAPPVGPVPSPTACVRPAADLFAGQPADALVRRRGVLASVLLLTAVDADGDVAAGRLPQLLSKVQSRAVPAVLALKRVPVLDRPTNHNPALASILSLSGSIEDGALLGRDEWLMVLYPYAADPREHYEQVDLDGAVTARTEELDEFWLSGFGRFEDWGGSANIFYPATGEGIDLPPPGPPGAEYLMPLAVVVRDRRGGEQWIVRSVKVARP